MTALPGAGSPRQGICGCLPGTGGSAGGRDLAGSDSASRKSKERETGYMGYPLLSSFPAAGWEGWCQHGQEGRASPGHCDGSRIPSSDGAIEIFPEPFPAPVCQTPFEVAGAAFLEMLLLSQNLCPGN